MLKSQPSIFRFSARLVLTALISAQISPISAWAEPSKKTLRANQRESETGLEEIRRGLLAPAGLEEASSVAGFATKVDPARTATVGVQVARRRAGRVQLRGRVSVQPDEWILHPDEISAVPDAERPTVERVVDWAQEGLRWLAAHRDLPAVQTVWAPLQGRQVSVEFLADHSTTVGFMQSGAALTLDTTVAQELADQSYDQGRRILYALGLFYGMALSAFPERQAVHLVVALYEGLQRHEREALHAILLSPHVDHGGIWDFFFRQVTDDALLHVAPTRVQRALPRVNLQDAEFRGVDTMRLVARRDTQGVSEPNQARLDWVIDFRDTWVSWLTGMLQFDIPFDYQEFMRIYRDQGMDLDAKKLLLYRILRTYSRDVEQANAERVARAAARSGQILVGGRYSTAFVDQANEVASSQRVTVTDELRKAAADLHAAAVRLQGQAQGPAAEQAGILVRNTEGLLTAVSAAAGVTDAEVMRFLDPDDNVGLVYGALEKYRLLRDRAVSTEEGGKGRRTLRDSMGGDYRFDRGLFRAARAEIEKQVKELRELAEAVTDAFRRAPMQTNARMVAFQRPSPTGSINYAYGIGYAPRPGQAPNLRERMRTGGQNTWMSPDLEWVKWVDFLVEFIPLFIGERILRYELPDGRVVERREVEVDQRSLEGAVRAMADAFAENIERTMRSEYIAVAREAVVETVLGPGHIDALIAERRVSREEACRLALDGLEPERRDPLTTRIARAALRLDAWANDRDNAEQIEQAMVAAWTEGRQIGRFDLLREMFLVERDGTSRSAAFLDQMERRGQPKSDPKAVGDLAREVLEPRRQMPMWVMGTTEAPGLTDAFVLSWLEQEMAMRNVIRAAGREKEVAELTAGYRRSLTELGRVILQEFGYEKRIQARAAEQGISEDQAVLELVDETENLQQEVANLAVLRARVPDADQAVDRLLTQAPDAVRLAVARRARQMVWEQNRMDLQADVDRALGDGAHNLDEALEKVIPFKEVLGRKLYLEHLESAHRWVARDTLIREHGFQGEAQRWYRDHTQLARTTARQTVVHRSSLRELMEDPRYNYQSDSNYLDAADQWTASPRKMRYLVATGPSQVDLAGEASTSTQLRSIKVWPQWVGVVSLLGEQRARQLFASYHYRVQVVRLDQAEDLKVLKNSWTALRRAIANLMSGVTINDPQQLMYQVRMHGDPLADMVAFQDTDKPGATSGYCIPKDILFKVFVARLQNAEALRYIGVPDDQIEQALALLRRIWAERNDHGSPMEWERWAVQQIIQLNEKLRDYINIGERGILVFNMTRILRMLDQLGMPAGFPGFTKDLYQGMIAAVAAGRIADLEAVNRAAGLNMAVELLRAAAYAREINPDAQLTPDHEARYQLPAAYKGTGRGTKQLADVRYSRTLTIAHLMTTLPGVARESKSGLEEASADRLLEPLVASLRPQDEALLFLGLRGFQPESNDPIDRRVTRFVAETMLGITRRTVEVLPGFIEARQAVPPGASDYLDRLETLVTEWIAGMVLRPEYAQQAARLRREFPPRVAPGFVRVTASPQTGVDDVLGYITEKHLWEEAAEKAAAVLLAHGITLQQIQAHARSGDSFPKWIAHLPAKEQEEIRRQVGGGHIPLALREGGLGTDFRLDIQGMDVVEFGVPHDDVLDANPAHIVQSMMRGNPGSLLVIGDHSVQGRARIWNAYRDWAPDAMLAFAAALAFDSQGRPIADWKERAVRGRRATYVANTPLHAGSPIIERWRQAELQMEQRGIRLFEALERVAQAKQDRDRRAAVKQALEVFRREVDPVTVANLYTQVSEYEAMVGPDALKLAKPRDRAMAASLSALQRGMNTAVGQRSDHALWLGYASPAEIAALGLMFLLNGEDRERIEGALETVRQALGHIRAEQERLGLTLNTQFTPPMDPAQSGTYTGWLIEPRIQFQIPQRRARDAHGSSVKAPETVTRTLAQRAALLLEAEREVNLGHRLKGYREVADGAGGTAPAADLWTAAAAGVRADLDGVLTAMASDPADFHRRTGRVFAWTQRAAHAAIDQWMPDVGERARWHERINTLTQGRQLNEEAWRGFVQLHGLLPRLFELAGNDAQGRAAVGRLMEMAYACLALERMSPYPTLERRFVNEPVFWLDLLDFFQMTINDHFDERLPWAFSLARGAGFQEFFDPQERLLENRRADFDLYQFAWENHAWLYQFLRAMMLDSTQLADWPEARRDQLVGRFLPGEAVVPPIGGGAPAGDGARQSWNGYLHLREIANWAQTSVAMLQDTFGSLAQEVGPVGQAMMPYVFMRPVNPDRLEGEERDALCFFGGVGRPHYQYLLREGATDALDGNLFITQHGRFLTRDGREPATAAEFDGAVLCIDDAHYWVPLARFREMLIQDEGLAPDTADQVIAALQKAKQVHPKGVRVASRFTRPVPVGAAVVLHHHYLERGLSQAGYPTTDKSEVLFEVTYDKVLGPAIVQGTSVPYPFQANVYQGSALDQIQAAVGEFVAGLPFAEFFVKGSRESGARNLQNFVAWTPEGGLNQEALQQAAVFTHQVSAGQHVVLSQDVSLTNSNQTFLTPEMAWHFRNRAVHDFGVDVNLTQPGKADVTTVRVTAVSPGPSVPYQVAHVLAISSYSGRVTNLARQNVAEPLRPEFVRPELRSDFFGELTTQAREAMKAMADFSRRFWHEGVTLPDGRRIPPYKETYKEKHGMEPREFDARGVPYWHPTWLMLDFIPAAMFGDSKSGQPLQNVRLVDVEPGDPQTGGMPVFWLEDRHGNRIRGAVTGHVPWLLEWNTGIGQIPEYNRREQYWEFRRARQAAHVAGQPGQWLNYLNWNNIGVADRTALAVWLKEAREIRQGKGFPQRWPRMPSSVPLASSSQAPAEPFFPPAPPPVVSPPTLTIVPVMQAPDPITPQEMAQRLRHPHRFAVVVGKNGRMDHAFEPFALSAVGHPVNVVGVHTDWLTEDGRVTRLYLYDTAAGRCWDCRLTEPMRLENTRAYIVDLPEENEIRTHMEVTARLRRGGIEPVNPSGKAQRRADDKTYLVVHYRRDQAHWTVVPLAMQEPEIRELVGNFIQAHPGERFLAQPTADTTGAEGVHVFEPGPAQLDAAVTAITALQAQGHRALIQRFWGNLTFDGREFILRSNIAAGRVQSNTILVAPPGETIVSLGRGAVAYSMEEVLNHLTRPDGTQFTIDPARLAELDQEAAAIAEILHDGVPPHQQLGLFGVDRRFWVDAAGQLQQIVLEANARAGGFIAAEPQAVGPTFWASIGFTTASGLEESATFNLERWQRIAADPVGTGLRSRIAQIVPPNRVDDELVRVRALIAEAATREKLFDPNSELSLGFSPGRVRFFAGHTDFRGLGGQTINAAVQYGVWMLVQMRKDGRVVIENMDPRYKPLRFGMDDKDVLPPEGIRQIRPDWLGWAQTNAMADQWEALIKGVLAFIRTEYLDPAGLRRQFLKGKGFTGLVAESPLAPGRGLSSSSAVPGVFGQALNPFLPEGVQLGASDLDLLDYSNYLAGGRAGTADLTAINAGQLGTISVLWSFPDRLAESVVLPEDFRFFIVDSRLTRLDDKSQPPDVQNFAAFVKSLTGMGYALGALWLRQIARSDPDLGLLEEVLMASGEPARPYGLLRELTEAGALVQPKYVPLVGGSDAGARRAFVAKIMAQIPNDWTVAQLRQALELHADLRAEFDQLMVGFTPLGAHLGGKVEELRPNTVIPLQQMVRYGVLEVERGLEYVRLAAQGDGKGLIRLMREAHNGDRAVWTLGNDGKLVLTPWGQRQPAEAYFRSLLPIDDMVDRFQTALDAEYGNGSVAGRIMAMGLGGAIAIGTTAEAFETAKQYWREQGHELIEIEPSGGATVIRLSASAGLEEPLAALQAPISWDTAAGLAQALAVHLNLPAYVLEPAFDGEYYPISGPDLVAAILHHLSENAQEHVPEDARDTARFTLALLGEPINPHLTQRTLRIRYEDNNSRPFGVPIQRAIERAVTTKQDGKGGFGLFHVRQTLATVPNAQLTIEATEPDGQRRQYRFRKAHVQITDLPPAVGTRITVDIPVGDVSSRGTPVQDVAGRLRDEMQPVLQGVHTGLEEPDWGVWRQLVDPSNQSFMRSFSGIRAVVGLKMEPKVTQPLPDINLSMEYQLAFGRFGYLFGRRQIEEFQRADHGKSQFVFVIGRDPRPSGRAILEAQQRGILVAAEELGVRVRFIDAGVLPTPFVEGLVRMTDADGGVIVTASHNEPEWNGVKYPTAAHEPGNSLVQGGILLPAGVMAEIVRQFQVWAGDVNQNATVGHEFVAKLNAGRPDQIVSENADPDQVIAHMVKEARQMWSLEREAEFEQFRERAAQVRIVLDPNGGAAAGVYQVFLRAFGFDVIEINSESGQRQHKLEPVDEALNDAKEALTKYDADFAVVFDWDADRGNLLIRDRATGKIEEPTPQAVAALNVAMALARRSLIRQHLQDKRPMEVVVHNFTSRRVWEIARLFGANVHVVEIGEVNVLEKMRELERAGRRVVIGIEGANGGTVFRGDHAVFQGDSSRNGAMTALFAGMVLTYPEIGRTWLNARNAGRPDGVPKAHIPESPGLVALARSLPGEHGKGPWRFHTPLAKMGSQGDVPEELVLPFKQAVEDLWYDKLWPYLRDHGLTRRRQGFTTFRIIHHVETAESPSFGPGDQPGSGLGRYGNGGTTFELETSDGMEAFLGLRGSLTEGVVRVVAEGQGPMAKAVGAELLKVFRNNVYFSALQQARRKTGLEEWLAEDQALRRRIAEFMAGLIWKMELGPDPLLVFYRHPKLGFGVVSGKPQAVSLSHPERAVLQQFLDQGIDQALQTLAQHRHAQAGDRGLMIERDVVQVVALSSEAGNSSLWETSRSKIGQAALWRHLVTDRSRLAGTIDQALERYFDLPSRSGLEETLSQRASLPEAHTSVVEGLSIIAGPHPSALAIGAAISHLTTAEGKLAAKIVFVVENRDLADEVRQRAQPLMVFSADEHPNGLQGALNAAREVLPQAQELGTDNKPVQQTIQRILRLTFGIELSPESVDVWNSYIERVRATLSRWM